MDGPYTGTLADLAARFGWFDQPHFTREFTDHVGTTPGAYRARNDERNPTARQGRTA